MTTGDVADEAELGRRNASWVAGGMLELIFDANAKMVEWALSQLIGERCLRVNHHFEGRLPGLDDGRKETMDRMLATADRTWEKQGKAILDFVRRRTTSDDAHSAAVSRAWDTA